MPMSVEHLLLAAPDGMSVGLILFLIVSFVSWIHNLIKGNQGDGKSSVAEKLDRRQRQLRAAANQRRRRQRPDDELDEVEWEEDAQPQLVRAQARSLAEVERGASVSEHVEQHMRTATIADHVEEYLDHDVDKSVVDHLGPRTSPRAADGSAETGAVSAVVQMLRDPVSVRRAIIINEVLMPPKALRSRR